jgi:hypothetical protein
MPGPAMNQPTIMVTAGQSTVVNLSLAATQGRFDSFEGESLLILPPAPYVPGKEEVVA